MLPQVVPQLMMFGVEQAHLIIGLGKSVALLQSTCPDVALLQSTCLVVALLQSTCLDVALLQSTCSATRT